MKIKKQINHIIIFLLVQAMSAGSLAIAVPEDRTLSAKIIINQQSLQEVFARLSQQDDEVLQWGSSRIPNSLPQESIPAEMWRDTFSRNPVSRYIQNIRDNITGADVDITVLDSTAQLLEYLGLTEPRDIVCSGYLSELQLMCQSAEKPEFVKMVTQLKQLMPSQMPVGNMLAARIYKNGYEYIWITQVLPDQSIPPDDFIFNETYLVAETQKGRKKYVEIGHGYYGVSGVQGGRIGLSFGIDEDYQSRHRNGGKFSHAHNIFEFRLQALETLFRPSILIVPQAQATSAPDFSRKTVLFYAGFGFLPLKDFRREQLVNGYLLPVKINRTLAKIKNPAAVFDDKFMYKAGDFMLILRDKRTEIKDVCRRYRIFDEAEVRQYEALNARYGQNPSALDDSEAYDLFGYLSITGRLNQGNNYAVLIQRIGWLKAQAQKGGEFKQQIGGKYIGHIVGMNDVLNPAAPYLDIKPQDTVLDIGFAVGGETIGLAAAHPEADFVMANPELRFVQHAVRQAESYRPLLNNLRIAPKVFEELALPAHSVNHIIIRNIFFDLDEVKIKDMLIELMRIAAPDATIVITGYRHLEKNTQENARAGIKPEYNLELLTEVCAEMGISYTVDHPTSFPNRDARIRLIPASRRNTLFEETQAVSLKKKAEPAVFVEQAI
ncbi:MAG: class I SAM-dependent methyltransferase [Candidatus Omnitrophota bacterium]